VGWNRRRQPLVLDCVTHRPDLPLYPGGSERWALLCGIVAGTFAVEGSDVRPASRSPADDAKQGPLGTIAWWR